MSSPSILLDDSTKDTSQDEQMSSVESRRLMTEFSIAHDGRYYHYDGYRYERLADAVAYAEVIRARQSQRPNSSSIARFETVEPPNASDRRLMTELSIAIENGRFVFAGFRYDRLIDAANYARDHGHRSANAS